MVEATYNEKRETGFANLFADSLLIYYLAMAEQSEQPEKEFENDRS